MSTYEAAYAPLLQGVTQQQPQERLPGQVNSQVNMVSDPVSGVRRRPGVKFKKHFQWPTAHDNSVVAWFTSIGRNRMHVLLNTVNGDIQIFGENFEPLLDKALNSPYLVTNNAASIRAASVNNQLFILNFINKPQLVYGMTDTDPARQGFFYIAAGGFGRTYTVTAVGTTVSYTTPGGSGAGDAALSTPEYIAQQLAVALGAAAPAGTAVNYDGPYVFVEYTAPISVTSPNSSNFIVVSKQSMVNSVGLLPARLPPQANGYRCRVGAGESAQYYRYQSSTGEWLEDAKWGSPTSINNCPISIVWDNATNSAAIDSTPFEGRLAGDDENNPIPQFATEGFTGIGTHQGRLVLLSGPRVSMSASLNPRRFMRSTVTNVVNSDPIEVGSSMLSAASYEWAVPFQKDLLLFSRAYQAVVPSGNSVITPSNATVVPTSSHETDTRSSPVTLGRTLMYPSPRSLGYIGVMEMIPSNFTDSQYVSQDSTPHLPRYLQGQCRFAVSSGSSNLVAFAPEHTPKKLIVHEYQWDGDTKAQQAWHEWDFEYTVANAYFAADYMMFVFVQNGQVVLGALDPRSGSYSAHNQRGTSSFLDLSVDATVSNNQVSIPYWMQLFDPSIATKLKLAVRGGALEGDPVGSIPNGFYMGTVPSFKNVDVYMGIPYRSSINPGPPVVRDYKDQPIHTGKATLLRYMVTTENTDPYSATVSDKHGTYDTMTVEAMGWENPELNLERGQYSTTGTSIIPCRTDLRSTEVELFTDGTGEMNILSLEYVARFHPKIQRR